MSVLPDGLITADVAGTESELAEKMQDSNFEFVRRRVSPDALDSEDVFVIAEADADDNYNLIPE